MVHGGRAEDRFRGDLEWSSSGSTASFAEWSVPDDEVRKEGVGVVVASTPVGGSADRADGGRAWSGVVLGGKCRGGAQVVAELWMRIDDPDRVTTGVRGSRS